MSRGARGRAEAASNNGSNEMTMSVFQQSRLEGYLSRLSCIGSHSYHHRTQKIHRFEETTEQ